MRDTVVESGMDGLAVEIRAALLEAERLGVRAGGRFEEYAEVLKKAGAAAYPRAIDDETEKRVLFEAMAQGRQLVDAMVVLREASDTIAAERLRHIMRGDVMPLADAASADHARNILFELATAAALKRTGFRVSLGRDRADLRAEFASLKPFIVECKRPFHDRTLEKNLTKVKKQLRDRKKCAPKSYGMAVIGVDRMVGVAGTALAFPSEAILRRAVEQDLLNMRTRIGQVLHPAADVVGVLLVGALFCADRGGVFNASQLRLFPAGAGEAPTVRKIMRAFEGTIPFDAAS